jgi:nucleotide-binding universal stress UspA family protein
MEKTYNRILCPTDFSSESAKALKEAMKLASVLKAELFVTHIITNPWSDIYSGQTKNDMPPEEALKVIEGMVKDFVEEHAAGVSCDILVKNHEHIYGGVIEYAEEKDADLIVMATSGRTGPKRFFLGSVAENVVRRAPCSVLVVR